MKVREFVEKMQEQRAKGLKEEQVLKIIEKELSPKTYIGIKEKKQLVQSIIDATILYSGGVFKFDEIDKYIHFTIKTLDAYTDLEFSDNIEEDYDLLCEAQLLNLVVALIQSEYSEISMLLSMKTDFILSENNIEAQVGRFFNELSIGTDNLIDAVVDRVSQFSLKDIPFNQETIQTVIKLLNSQGK